MSIEAYKVAYLFFVATEEITELPMPKNPPKCEMSVNFKTKKLEVLQHEAQAKSGWLVLTQYQIDSERLTKLMHSFKKRSYHMTKQAAIDAAYKDGYTHYSYKDVVVKFRDRSIRKDSLRTNMSA